MTLEFHDTLDWSEPHIVDTRRGLKSVQNATPNDAFWKAWQENKEQVKDAGYSVRKNEEEGTWEVSYWSESSGE